MSQTWTTLSLITWTTGYFEKYTIASPRLDAEILLAHTLNLNRVQLYMQFDRPITADELAAYKKLILRRAAHEPIAYICGQKEFYSLTFKVGPGVLIPRPETELLVEAIIKHPALSDKTKPIRFFEVGTGSGNIAILLAKNFPAASVTTWDIADEAIGYANQNAITHGVDKQINFVKKNFLENTFDEEAYDVFVSNPPYINKETMETLMPDVKNHEPHTALSGGDDGLIFYKQIAERLKKHLEWRIAVLEIGDDQGVSVPKLFDGMGSLKVIKDYQNLDRVVIIERTNG